MKKPYIIALVVAGHLVFFWLLMNVRLDTSKPQPPKYVEYDVLMPKPVAKNTKPNSVTDVSPIPLPGQNLNPELTQPEKAANTDPSK